MAASLDAQRLRAAGQWTEAKTALAICADEACPVLVRNDCTTWTAEVLAGLPTVVFGAQDADGHDVGDLQVKVDGQVVAGGSAGQAVPINPGTHRVEYLRPDGSTIEDQFLLRQGEKGRSLVLKFPPQVPPPPTPPARPATSSRFDTILGVVSGGAGLGLLGAGVYFFVAQSSETNTLQQQCAGSACHPNTPVVASLSSQVTTVNTNRALAGASFGVGAAALGVGAFFLLAHPLAHRATGSGEAPSPPSTLASFDVTTTRSGGVLSYGRAF